MARFRLEIQCDTSAFSDDGEEGQGALPEVGRMLEALSRKLKRTTTSGQMNGGLMDGNGHVVGLWFYDD